jgi:D-alanyl-D-alanine carboxypeptidase
MKLQLQYVSGQRKNSSALTCMVYFLFLALVGGSSIVHAQASSQNEVKKPLAEQFDAILASNFPVHLPGASIIVSKQGKIIFKKSYGLADVENKRVMQVEMPMRIGSNTKQFTALAIMQLVDAGKLRLSDNVQQYLPDYPNQGKKISIEHLLTHTGGVTNYKDTPAYRAMHGKRNSVQEVIDYFKNEKPDFEPGEKYFYSNTGYILLGAIIEKVSGMSYENYLTQHVFQVLGMQQTSQNGTDKNEDQLVVGYQTRGEQVKKGREINDSLVYSAGVITSTVDDLAKWDAAISTGKLLKPASWKKSFSPYTLKDGELSYYGYGWQIGKVQGHDMQYHGGNVNGYVSHTLRMPNEGIYIAILSNRDDHETRPSMLAEKLAAIMLGQPFPDMKSVNVEESILDTYVGAYQRKRQEPRKISRNKNQLLMEVNGKNYPLVAVSNTEFWIQGRSFRIRFELNEQTKEPIMRVNQSGIDSVLDRVR